MNAKHEPKKVKKRFDLDDNRQLTGYNIASSSLYYNQKQKFRAHFSPSFPLKKFSS